MSRVIEWEYLIVPLEDAGKVKKGADLRPEHLNELGSQRWEAVGISLKKGRSRRVARRDAQASGHAPEHARAPIECVAPKEPRAIDHRCLLDSLQPRLGSPHLPSPVAPGPRRAKDTAVEVPR